MSGERARLACRRRRPGEDLLHRRSAEPPRLRSGLRQKAGDFVAAELAWRNRSGALPSRRYAEHLGSARVSRVSAGGPQDGLPDTLISASRLSAALAQAGRNRHASGVCSPVVGCSTSLFSDFSVRTRSFTTNTPYESA